MNRRVHEDAKILLCVSNMNALLSTLLSPPPLPFYLNGVPAPPQYLNPPPLRSMTPGRPTLKILGPPPSLSFYGYAYYFIAPPIILWAPSPLAYHFMGGPPATDP
jgi:hypothetical protein